MRTMPPFADPDLSFDRTVDRRTIHRRNLTEVFLTDVRRVDEDTFAAAALLPVAHAHYTSHTGSANRIRDPMLLVECCRQAETFAAHELFAVPPGTGFVLRSWSLRLDPHPVRTAQSGPTHEPPELYLHCQTHGARRIGGELRSLGYQFTLWLDGTRLGTVDMQVGYVAPATYTLVRCRGRQGAPRTSDRGSPVDAGEPVTPQRVGRINAADALLCAVADDGDRVSARLRVATEHPSLFDHVHDHVPGTVLVEGARQLAALATHERGGPAPHETTMLSMDATFSAYAELDQPIAVSATLAGSRTGALDPAAPRQVDVVYRQGGHDIARVCVVMAVAAGSDLTTEGG
ncbi:ScbA/BarX family gamma-butyrolactone biosynthesis protein [Dactylosporangium sp. NPDC005555]|uniref:ScbA/BarX family gamma-butyrolactone biosynthesis protein n=1 Tax=Dactylosporangium sp. NPDC005555 TaxID=3154889 RepID=UPI0033BBFE8C